MNITDPTSQATGPNRRIGLVDTSAPIADGREFRAMATIETAERLAVRAYNILADPDTDADVAVEHALLLLSELTNITSQQSANEVKTQADSDTISADASEAVNEVVQGFAPSHRAIAESYSRVAGRYEQ